MDAVQIKKDLDSIIHRHVDRINRKVDRSLSYMSFSGECEDLIVLVSNDVLGLHKDLITTLDKNFPIWRIDLRHVEIDTWDAMYDAMYKRGFQRKDVKFVFEVTQVLEYVYERRNWCVWNINEERDLHLQKRVKTYSIFDSNAMKNPKR